MTIRRFSSGATPRGDVFVPREVAVVGAGVVGCAVARQLAADGHRVVLLDRGRPTSEATWAAGGMLSPLGEAHDPGPFLDLALRSLDLYPEFVRALEEESGVDPGFRRCGKLLVALEAGAEDRLETRLRWQRDAGFDVRWLEGETVREVEPGLSGDVRCALHLPTDGVVDNRRLGDALWRAAEARGALLRAGEAVEALTSARGRVSGVRTVTGTHLPADAVVISSGAWSGALQGLPRDLPVRPVRGQMLALNPPRSGRADGAPGATFLAGVVAGPDVYLIPRHLPSPRLVVGASEEEVGFEPGTTDAVQARLLEAAVRLVPDLADARVTERWHGFRPGTPDDLPFVGRDRELEGLIYATGHYRNGILLAPATAEIVSDLVAGRGGAPAAFDAHRFADGVSRAV